MKKTDHCLAYEKNENVLALFTGAHSYISASVYEKPAVASTWNYKSVHAKGKIRLLGNEETRIIIRDLTDHYENPATSAAAFHKMDDAYIEKHLKAISGFEIVITDLDAIFKLSQNHSEGNRKAIVSDLENRRDPGSHDVASEMKKNL
jgi:transcriptional regulator